MKLFRCFLFVHLLLISSINGYTQIVLPAHPESSFSTYYWQKVSHLETLPKTKNERIFIGDSITDGGEWTALFNDPLVMNMGISGDVSAGIINRLPAILKRQPASVFIMIGVNDLARNVSVDSLYKNIGIIVKYIKQERSSIKVFVQSILPVNNSFKTFSSHTSKADSIIKLNTLLNHNSKNLNYTFINLYPSFCDAERNLKKDFTNDGLHLKGAGYVLWKHLIYPYVYQLQQEVSLIPKPKYITLSTGLFPLYQVKYISYSSDSLKNEAISLQKILAKSGIEVSITNKITNIQSPFIKLESNVSAAESRGKAQVQNRAAYQLKVDTQKVLIKATGKAGIYYGIQTLCQLARDGYFIKAVDIKDEPAFSWRAYMVDVGRNYQSISLLKQQIDVMAAYKLNVFHMHLTEDIAWRIAIKCYPDLTNPEFMERNKGMYYTEAELKDLISYCKDRQILFVPEIDMPGHSAAFKKAMKTDMQSDSGLVIVKNILKEFCETYDLPYLHIGADEVKITNKNFLPEISAFLKSLNKKVIGWEPGGNFDPSTIRQLWMDDAGLTSGKTKIQYIDSRHLYLNHMDPLESVVTIFNRQLADVNKGNAEALGATLCLWPDRAVAVETDAIRMNGVYPAMLAFAERSWLGNGYQGWVANIDLNGKNALTDFKEFEERLMDHGKQYFTGLFFPYQKQADLSWKLYGPYDNEGDLTKQFEPETLNFKPEISNLDSETLNSVPEKSNSVFEKSNSEKSNSVPEKLNPVPKIQNLGSETLNLDSDRIKPTQTALGGTIILRHWWAPKIKGVLKNPKENTTWYAFQKIWSDQDTTRNFWIGFNNFSRSQATDSPPKGQWDNHQSKVWVNNELINPPLWLHAAQMGNLEIPLVDEGYEYRVPTLIKLKKGWNTVRVKAPIGSFKGKNWNNPEKWMFTFIQLATNE